jgi:hypothetical protein
LSSTKLEKRAEQILSESKRGKEKGREQEGVERDSPNNVYTHM